MHDIETGHPAVREITQDPRTPKLHGHIRVQGIATVERDYICSAKVPGEHAGLPLGIGKILNARSRETDLLPIRLQRFLHLLAFYPALSVAIRSDEIPTRPLHDDLHGLAAIDNVEHGVTSARSRVHLEVG